MNVDTTKNLTCAFCTTDGGTTIAVENSRYDAESFNAELETEYRSRIGLETWGDNKVDNKVDNNARGDIKVDNNVEDYAEKHPQTRTRTTPVQHPYNETQFRTTTVPIQDPNETDYQPTRKRLNHRGPLSIDVSSAWYFITICADGHAPWVGSRVPRDRDSAVGSRVPRDRNVEQMDFATIADSILSAARWYHEHGKWFLALFLVMPDHLHFIAQFSSTCGHAGRVTLPMVSIIQQFKSYLVRTFGLRFQRDFFDTRLRDDAHFAEEYDYVLGNPVRKGLCAAPADWPYSLAFTRDGEEIPVTRPA